MTSVTCGCQGDASNPGCQFAFNPTPTCSESTCQEFVCSAGGIPVGDGTDPSTCATGSPPTLDQLKQVWQTNDCPNLYIDILYGTPLGTTPPSCSRTYNPDQLSRLQADANNLLTTYVGYGKEFTDRTGSAQYDVFQEQLIAMCANQQLPGVCDLFLGGQNGYCSQFTRDQIGSDRSLNQMCGCYAPSSYGDTVGVQCDPLCHLTSTVQRIGNCSSGTDPSCVPCMANRCSNTVCVIDDVNINLVGGSTSKVPAFVQICPGCLDPNNPCTCIISSDTSVTDTLYRSGVGPTYTQYCGNDATCLVGDEQVACPLPSTFAPPTGGSTFIIIFVVILFIILLFAGLIMLATKHTVKETYTTNNQQGYSAVTGPVPVDNSGAPVYSWN